MTSAGVTDRQTFLFNTMTIYINNKQIQLPHEPMTVAELLKWKRVPEGATAVAINNKLVEAKNFAIRQLADGDQLLIISAAFGG